MKVVNRSSFVVRPREPYIAWASSVDDGAVEAAHGLRDHVSVYLVPEDLTGRGETPPLIDFYDEIFMRELAAWSLDEATWPEPRTLEMFQAWFEVAGQSVVEDLADDPIIVEEL